MALIGQALRHGRYLSAARRSSVVQRLLRASLSQLGVVPVAVRVPNLRMVSPLPSEAGRKATWIPFRRIGRRRPEA